eukprot:4092655-Pleurochrysis_carterae.AAC.3
MPVVLLVSRYCCTDDNAVLYSLQLWPLHIHNCYAIARWWGPAGGVIQIACTNSHFKDSNANRVNLKRTVMLLHNGIKTHIEKTKWSIKDGVSGKVEALSDTLRATLRSTRG